MFAGVRNFLSRHKRKFIVGGVIVGGSVLALRYAQRKLREFQEEQAREFLEKTRRLQHFESTERTCNQTIMGLAPSVFEEISRLLSTEEILEQLRKKPENKKELWEEMKVVSFTRLTTMVYASSILVVTLRIQLNLVGGYLYRDTTKTTPTGMSVTPEVRQMYLALVQHFLRDGLKELSRLIEDKVRHIMKDYDLKKRLTIGDLEQIFWSIQMAVNNDARNPNSHLARYVFPEDVNGNDVLIRLFTETLDLLDSEEVSMLCTNNVSHGFSVVVDFLVRYYTEPNGKRNGLADVHSPQDVPTTSKEQLNKIFDINSVESPLAKLIPIVNGLASKHFSESSKPQSLATSLVILFLVSDKIKILGANVYEVFNQ
ncbi:peroxisomal biogenesis factor 3 [Phlebotomus argentipes]|uniref:peroxisomal biogenesis factor 3 n=1 Tax=Phlebotomus argentipes TaxID=94469 RepID=UPI002892CE8C|nr:peroxisomal biogenesis factor 3 [Phlebotomus argentipes]